MTSSARPSATEISAWLQARVAHLLGIYADDIDLDTSFPDFGLDSVTALDVLGGLEDWLGRELPPTLLVKHDTVRKLAQHLGRGA